MIPTMYFNTRKINAHGLFNLSQAYPMTANRIKIGFTEHLVKHAKKETIPRVFLRPTDRLLHGYPNLDPGLIMDYHINYVPSMVHNLGI
jgi:hypothetical protein